MRPCEISVDPSCQVLPSRNSHHSANVNVSLLVFICSKFIKKTVGFLSVRHSTENYFKCLLVPLWKFIYANEHWDGMVCEISSVSIFCVE